MLLHTVNQEIFTNDLFGKFDEPIKNVKFNPAKILSRLIKTIIHSRINTIQKFNPAKILSRLMKIINFLKAKDGTKRKS